MSDFVRVCEVGPRDGLQMIADFVPTDVKIAWVERVAAAGVPEIEVTSLVPPRVLAQFADAQAVIGAACEQPGLTVAALVPNLRGAERAMDAGAHTVDFVMAATKTFSRRNLRREPEESLEDFRRIVALRDARAPQRRTRLKAGISAALGCAYEGRVAVDDVRRYAHALIEAGADELLIADTVGYADPVSVRTMFEAIAEEAGDVPVGAHFHDTRGLGLANVVAALDCGVRIFDASLAGLGGCPFAPGASGNIVTEDLAFLLESMGLTTGIDLEQLIDARAVLRGTLDPAELHGKLASAGRPVSHLDPPAA